MNTPKTRDKLIKLGAEKLADALLKLAEQNEEVDDYMEHILSTPSENVVRFKAKLAGLKRRTRFITWAESRYFAQDLETMLENLEAGIKTPEEGLELVADFFKSDRYIFELCDDSGGYVGDVFRCNACTLFIKFANSCRNKTTVLQLLKNLYKKDDYGVRFCPIESASQYLSENDIRILIEEFEKEALKYEDDSREKCHWQREIGRAHI